MRKTLLLLAIPLLLSSAAFAEEIDVSAEDLNIEEPSLLPDSPFYFFKEWGRNIRSFFTFDSVAKMELENQYANEKLLELKKLVEENRSEQAIKETNEEYQRRVRKIEEIAERAQQKEGVSSFLDKYTNHQILHQRILEKLEQQVPEEAFERIRETREEHLERFKEVMLKLEEGEQIPERIADAIEKQKGNEFKEFKNMEIMERIREKMPEEIQEKLEEKQNQMLERLRNKIENAPEEQQERFQNYVKEVPGDAGTKLRIMERIEAQVKEKPILRQRMQETKSQIIE